MEIIIDNKVVGLLVHDVAKLIEQPCLISPGSHVTLRWPSLLEYLGLGSVFSMLPAFDHNQPLFEACVSTLCANDEKEAIFYIYDSLFAESLSQIKALPQIQAHFLLQAIKERRQTPVPQEIEKWLSSALSGYETAFVENASHMMHDLILYLAWDRMCVWMGHLFNYQTTDLKFVRAIAVLKECLIESYQHIIHQGRTIPSFYRMVEALFFYQMREESIQKHTDEEWIVLSQSFPVLKAQNELADVFYIDDAVISEQHLQKNQGNPARYVTLDSCHQVSARLALTQYMMSRLKQEVVDWDFILQLKKTNYLDLK